MLTAQDRSNSSRTRTEDQSLPFVPCLYIFNHIKTSLSVQTAQFTPHFHDSCLNVGECKPSDSVSPNGTGVKKVNLLLGGISSFPYVVLNFQTLFVHHGVCLVVKWVFFLVSVCIFICLWVCLELVVLFCFVLIGFNWVSCCHRLCQFIVCSTSRLHSSPVVLIWPNALWCECKWRNKGTSCFITLPCSGGCSHSCATNHALMIINNQALCTVLVLPGHRGIVLMWLSLIVYIEK